MIRNEKWKLYVALQIVVIQFFNRLAKLFAVFIALFGEIRFPLSIRSSTFSFSPTHPKRPRTRLVQDIAAKNGMNRLRTIAKLAHVRPRIHREPPDKINGRKEYAHREFTLDKICSGPSEHCRLVLRGWCRGNITRQCPLNRSGSFFFFLLATISISFQESTLKP